MNKFLSSLLASTLLLGAVGTSFALETTETIQNTEILQEIHTDPFLQGVVGTMPLGLTIPLQAH